MLLRHIVRIGEKTTTNVPTYGTPIPLRNSRKRSLSKVPTLLVPRYPIPVVRFLPCMVPRNCAALSLVEILSSAKLLNSFLTAILRLTYANKDPSSFSRTQTQIYNSWNNFSSPTGPLDISLSPLRSEIHIHPDKSQCLRFNHDLPPLVGEAQLVAAEEASHQEDAVVVHTQQMVKRQKQSQQSQSRMIAKSAN